MRELCARFQIQSDDSDAIFDDLDRDSDGRISFEDFRNGFDDYEKGLIVTGAGDTSGGGSGVGHRPNKLRKSSANTLGSYGCLLKALETHNFSQTFAKHEYKPKKKLCQSDLNLKNKRLSEHYISDPTQDTQLNAMTVIQELLESVKELQEENQRLANSWMREKEEHKKHLVHLEQEVDSQVKEVEHRVKQKAKQEVEAEKKTMRELMKGEMEELQSHLSKFERIDSWLKTNQTNISEEKVNEIRRKLDESMVDSRQLRMSLMDTQTNVALMRSELSQLRTQYDDKCRELATEVGRVTEQQSEHQHLTRQLSLLQEANKKLHDTNDSLRSVVELSQSPAHSRRPSPEPFNERLKRGSVIGDYLSNDRLNGHGNLHMSSRLSEADLESVSVFGVEGELTCESARQSFSSCPPITSIKTIAGTDDMDSGLSSLKCRSHQSSPVLTGFYTRCESPHNRMVTDGRPDSPTPSYQSIGNTMSEATGAPDRTYKIIFIGDASVGKSTFILRLSKGVFAAQLATTLGVDFQVRTFNFDGMNIALQLWDTAGQERYRSITKNYFRKADGIMLLYDVTNEQSFLNVREWITTIEEVKAKGVPVMIVGNKTDLRPTLMAQDMKYVRAEDGFKIAQQYGLMFVETSCKDGQNVMASVAQMTKIMTQNEDNMIQSVLTLSDEKPKRFGCCSK